MPSFDDRSSDRAGRVFLLSPANCSGRRAAQVLSPTAGFDLAQRLQGPSGVPLGELFAFISGLYFRGKLAYSRHFGVVPPGSEGCPPVLVITPTAGLRDPDTHVDLEAIRTFAATSIDAANEAYRAPLESSARRLASESGDADIVLLGSIASGKYVDVLLEVFGDRLRFPVDFVGRGDMSRGGLMLRCVASGEELRYVPVEGTLRRGTRPPRLTPLTSPR